MARLPRIVIPNYPLHIMYRGNNRQDVFESEKDMNRIKEDIAEDLAKTDCRLHAYVIMTNHLHLLITPTDKDQLSKFMQTMANRYVRYFNASRQRTGTILIIKLTAPLICLILDWIVDCDCIDMKYRACNHSYDIPH